jgi:hypothetical protein
MIQAVASHHARAPSPATPAAQPLSSDLLRYGHPAWVRSLADAAAIALWGVALGLAAAVVETTAPGAAGRWAGPLAGITAAVVCARAAWKLTAPDPTGQVEMTSRAMRWTVRVALCAWVAKHVLQMFLVAAPADVHWLKWVLLAALCAGLAGVAGQFALLRHLSAMALRIPNPTLSHRAGFVGRGYPIAIAGVTLLGALAPGAAASNTFRAVAAYATIVVLVALCVYSVLYAHLLHRLRRALSIQGDYARGIASRAR